MKLHLSILLSLLAFSVFAQKTVQTNGNQTIWGVKTFQNTLKAAGSLTVATGITNESNLENAGAAQFDSSVGIGGGLNGTNDFYFNMTDHQADFVNTSGYLILNVQSTTGGAYLRMNRPGVGAGAGSGAGFDWGNNGTIVWRLGFDGTHTNDLMFLKDFTDPLMSLSYGSDEVGILGGLTNVWQQTSYFTNLTYAEFQGPLVFANVTASNPPAASATTASIFAATNAGTAEIFTQDGAGNITQISPHAADAPASLLELTDEMPMVTKEYNLYTGTARWINYSRAARRLEQLEEAVQWLFTQVNTNGLGVQTRERIQKILDLTTNQMQIVYVVTNYVPPVSWTSVQNQIQADYATSYTNALDAYNQSVLDGDTNAVPPVYNPPAIEPVPAWLAERGVQ